MDVFRDVAIYKEKIAQDLQGLADDEKLAELIDASKKVEVVLQGQMRSYMADLFECLSWRYASMQVRNTQSRLGFHQLHRRRSEEDLGGSCVAYHFFPVSFKDHNQRSWCNGGILPESVLLRQLRPSEPGLFGTDLEAFLLQEVEKKRQFLMAGKRCRVRKPIVRLCRTG